MEKLIERYYRETEEDQSKKFYLYRIEFTLIEIKYVLGFWQSLEPTLKILYNEK